MFEVGRQAGELGRNGERSGEVAKVKPGLPSDGICSGSALASGSRLPGNEPRLRHLLAV